MFYSSLSLPAIRAADAVSRTSPARSRSRKAVVTTNIATVIIVICCLSCSSYRRCASDNFSSKRKKKLRTRQVFFFNDASRPLIHVILSAVGSCGQLWAAVGAAVARLCGPPVWAAVGGAVGWLCGPPVWATVESSQRCRSRSLDGSGGVCWEEREREG